MGQRVVICADEPESKKRASKPLPGLMAPAGGDGDRALPSDLCLARDTKRPAI